MAHAPAFGVGWRKPERGAVKASPALEAFVDETIRLPARRDYHPMAFVGMRARLGVVEAISRLVVSGDVQSGFRRLRDLGLLDWTIEAAVLKFPSEFSQAVRECAAWRLDQVKNQGKESPPPS
jgi:hypothetical protein